MASQFLVNGYLFSEVININVGGGIPLRELPTSSQLTR